MYTSALQASFADAAEQRVSDRRVLRLEAQVATESGAGGIQVRNLSRSGLLLEGVADVVAGARIEVELPGGSSHQADVMWADETLFGCRFVQALTQAQLSAALLRSAPETPLVTAGPEASAQADALAKLREQWPDANAEDFAPARDRKLAPGARLWVIGGLGLCGWAVPAAAAWMLW